MFLSGVIVRNVSILIDFVQPQITDPTEICGIQSCKELEIQGLQIEKGRREKQDCDYFYALEIKFFVS